MTPQEKANELFSAYRFTLSIPNAPLGERKNEIAIQCALIAVDEIIKSNPSLPILGDKGYFYEDIDLSTKYWNEVRLELNKLNK